MRVLDVASGSGAVTLAAARLGAADDLMRERAAGADTTVLISPINIGIGTK
jgi:predicted nicotinamide N-methyase